MRIEILKDSGETEVVCLVSTDDEAFTYNKRVSRIAIVQEHKMIVKAIERGVSEQRIAKALDVDVPSLRAKVRLLNGICPEVADMLKDKHIAMNASGHAEADGAAAADRGGGADGCDEQVHRQLCPVPLGGDAASATGRT